MSIRTAIALAVFCTAAVAQDQWTTSATSPRPSPRYLHAMAYDSARGVTVLFGGTHATTGALLNDTWEWNGTTWNLRAPSMRPPSRNMHAMAYDAARGVTVLFGGLNHQSARFPDTWEWDGTNWTLRHDMAVNQERYLVAMAYDSARRRTVRFGGGGAGGVWGDTWAWNGTTWSLLTSFGPPARQNAQLAYDSVRDRMVLYAGEGSSGYLQDTWEYDGATWLLRQPTTVPPIRAAYAMAYDSAVARTILFGGLTTSTTTWSWDGDDWTARTPTGGPPPARLSAAMAYDSLRDRLVMFGGDYTNDDRTWEYFAPVLTRGSFTTYGSGCASSAGPLLLAAAPGNVPYVGSPFRIEIGPVPTGLFHIPFLILGPSRTTWSGLSLPFDLTTLNMPGCSLLASAEFALQIPRLGTTASLTLAIPYDPLLTGSRFYLQGLVTDATANPGGIAWSNAGEVLIGER
ncbi:MAG: hypothetical protein IPN34_15020 [Planctomycetes bacterium]|nr:hypothetical protein [Planctomycetota bacterium]